MSLPFARRPVPGKQTASDRQSAPDEQSAPSGNLLKEIRLRIDKLHAKQDLNGACGEAMRLAAMLECTQKNVGELAEHHKKLSETLETLTAPEHYAVTITHIERNGTLLAGVAGLGNSRLLVGVSPEVDPNTLRVGATALVARQRNCLLKVMSPTGHWQHVGTFERYLESSHRVLLRDRETLVAVDLADQLRATSLQKGDLIGYDRDISGIAYQRLEKPQSDDLFDEDVTDDFSQLGGLDSQIACIKQHIDFRFQYPQLAAKYYLKDKCGILLKGLPGNGKTRIARCSAGYVRRLFPDRPCRFMHVAGSSDYNMWFGETERKIIERFAAVREAAADGLVIMFWDEVDAIAKRRGSDHGSGAPDRILNTFLSQIDGVVPLANVVILFATNRPDTLDAGFLRAGRTDQKIEIPSPNRRATEAILLGYLSRGLPLAAAHGSPDELVAPLVSRLFAPSGDYAEVAQVKLNDGRRVPIAGRQLISGAMLENVVNVAAQHAAVREAATGQEGVTEQDLCLVLESEMTEAVSLLTAGNVMSYVKSIPQDAQPIAVDATLSSPMTMYTR